MVYGSSVSKWLFREVGTSWGRYICVVGDYSVIGVPCKIIISYKYIFT